VNGLQQGRDEQGDHGGRVGFTASLGLDDLDDVEDERAVRGHEEETEEEGFEAADAGMSAVRP
jgi:hypothetical protein